MRCFISLFVIVAVIVFAACKSPNIIIRNAWDARQSRAQALLTINPPQFVVIHHSAGDSCTVMEQCKRRVKSIQDFHMNTRHWKDIGYNFLVGDDGNVYEGRGWGKRGAHAPKYNSKSIGICIMGNFENNNPSSQQLETVKELIQYGVGKNVISSNYKLLGHTQADDTACPGRNLFREIQSWPHFANDL